MSIVVIGVFGVPSLAEGAADATAATTADAVSGGSWRDAILADVLGVYQAQPRAPDAKSEEAKEVSIFVREPVDPDVVVLEPLTVIERRLDLKGLERAMAREYGRNSGTQHRFGTGVLFSRDVGKVRVGVMSILYVPVMFGLSW